MMNKDECFKILSAEYDEWCAFRDEEEINSYSLEDDIENWWTSREELNHDGWDDENPNVNSFSYYAGIYLGYVL